MTKFFIIRCFLLVLVFGIFSTCKKYPEGGYTNRARKNILKHGGSWSLIKYEVNGVDSSDLINPANYNAFKKNFISFSHPQSSKTSYLGINFRITYSLTFSDSYSKLFFSDASFNGLEYLGTCSSSNVQACQRRIFMPEGDNTIWTIEKFTKKEIYLKCSLKSNYTIKLKCNG